MPRAGLSADAVVDAAAALADSDGLQAVSLTRVAEAVGVRTPSLYAHVDGLDDLRRRLGARGAREIAAVVRDAAVGRARGDALRAVAGAYREYAREHPGTYAAAQPAPDPRDEAGVSAGGEAVDVFRALLRGYGLEGSDAVHAIRAIRSAVHGFVSLEAAGGFGLAEEVDESFARLVDLLERGLVGR
jgi:AcrR family transcriptional regulator